MTREIKFRAWDKESNNWYHPSPFTLREAMALQWVHKNPLADLVFMQFTGLKDKNGKEIYEGDILVERGNYPNTTGWSPKPFKFPDYQRFSGGGYEESVWGIGYIFTDTEPELEKCEIIGNIYEDSDLLPTSTE